MSRNVNQLRRVFWDSLFHLIPWDRLGIGIELPGAAEYGNSPTLLWVISFLIKAHCCNPQKLRGFVAFSCSFLFFAYLCFYFFFYTIINYYCGPVYAEVEMHNSEVILTLKYGQGAEHHTRAAPTFRQIHNSVSLVIFLFHLQNMFSFHFSSTIQWDL